MKGALLLLAALASGCASAEMRSRENDPANPSATVAALDVGVGVLASGFSPDKIAPPGAVTPAATTYTCMHHPEVTSTTSGQCPKCGMDLVPREPASPHEGH